MYFGWDERASARGLLAEAVGDRLQLVGVCRLVFFGAFVGVFGWMFVGGGVVVMLSGKKKGNLD